MRELFAEAVFLAVVAGHDGDESDRRPGHLGLEVGGAVGVEDLLRLDYRHLPKLHHHDIHRRHRRAGLIRKDDVGNSGGGGRHLGHDAIIGSECDGACGRTACEQTTCRTPWSATNKLLKLKRTDIRDGALWIIQNKTGQRLGAEITGELAAVIARINQLPRHAISAYLIQDDNGQPLSQFALRSRFDKARTLAKVNFQFRDIRAKAATDTGDLAHSQTLLGHKNREMTKH